MEKIELNEMERDLIERHLRYEIGYYAKEGEPIALYHLSLTPEEQECKDRLIEKASALEEELDAIDERLEVFDCDLLLWYWLKYQEQRTNEK